MLCAAQAKELHYWRHRGSPVGLLGPEPQRNTAMTLGIVHLTAQIQNWLNVQVARHLAAQAARLTH